MSSDDGGGQATSGGWGSPSGDNGEQLIVIVANDICQKETESGMGCGSDDLHFTRSVFRIFSY